MSPVEILYHVCFIDVGHLDGHKVHSYKLGRISVEKRRTLSSLPHKLLWCPLEISHGLIWDSMGAVADMIVTLNFWQQVDSSSWVKAFRPSRLFGLDHVRGVCRYKQRITHFNSKRILHNDFRGGDGTKPDSSGPVCTNYRKRSYSNDTQSSFM
jgi:hypothetical protein